MKRFISYAVGIILAFGVVTLCGCTPIECNFPERPEPYEYGDFIYEHWYENQEEFKEYEHISIIGLTEQGKTKKELLIPEEINGAPVKYLGYRLYLNIIGELFSSNTEKLFLTKTYGSHEWFFYTSGHIYATEAEIYYNLRGVNYRKIRLAEREWKRLIEMDFRSEERRVGKECM